MTVAERVQLTLDFEPSLPERWGSLREYVQYRAGLQRKPLKSIAADMDISPSVLSRKLGPGEHDTNRFNCDDLERYMATTGDIAPIEYLASKYMQAAGARKAQALSRFEEMLPELERTLRLLKEGAD